MITGSFQTFMVLNITEDCINCRACDTICPSNAIYPGGKDYKLNDRKYRAPVKDYYYIVAEKCNFCEGFYDNPECISICPMNAIKEVKKIKNNGGSYE